MSERILIENLATYNPGRGSTSLINQDILIENGKVVNVGAGLKEQAGEGYQYIDGSGKIGLPGFVNAHDHPSQTFIKDVPEMQNQRIDEWIKIVSELSKKMDPEAHYHAARVKAMELLLSGATTTANMVYLFPACFDDYEIAEATIAGVSDVGLRHVFLRGSMSLSQKDGMLFPDDVVETSDQIVERTERIINCFHNAGNNAMIKVGVAPCTLFTSSTRDYQNAAVFAQRYDVCLQTHLSESAYEQEYVQEHHGMTPHELLESLGWDNRRATFAHCIEVTDYDIDRLRRNGSSVVHCPISNARSPRGQFGIAPISKMLDRGVNVALGVDGSAGNNSGNMLEEMKWARTMAGAREDSTYLSPDKVFDMATIRGALAFGCDSLGRIDTGKCADITIFDIRGSIGHLGTWDMLTSLISCQAMPAETVIINGKIVVQDGHHVLLDHMKVYEEAWKKWKEVFDKQ